MPRPKRLPSDRQYADEAKLLKEAMKWLEPQERDGIKALRICDRYTSGYSDLFICVKGLFVIAELKDETGRPTQQQIEFIESMQRCGAIGGVCRSVSDIADLIDEALRRKRVPYVYNR